MSDHKYGNNKVDAITASDWMDEPHKKMLEPCSLCGEPMGEEKDNIRFKVEYRCSSCDTLLGIAVIHEQ